MKISHSFFNVIPCWCISDDDRIKAIRENRSFQESTPHYFFIMTGRPDNKNMKGYLQDYNSQKPFDIIPSGYGLFDEYKRRKFVYVTFDRVTIYKLVEIIPTKPLEFIFRRVDDPQKTTLNKAFMIMPIGKELLLEEFYLTHIKLFLKTELGIDIYRSDDFNGNDTIIDTIYTQIEESEFIIADTSICNKNVFYELGWAAAKLKETITIQNEQVENQLFFDRAHIRAIFYSSDKVRDFQKRLKNDIIAIRQKISSKY